jgi:signal peptidase
MQRPATTSVIHFAGSAAQVLVAAVAVTVATILVVPRIAGWDVVTVLSGSMAPTYPTDSVLAVESVDPADIVVGEVIAFSPEPDALMVTHRVVSVSEGSDGLSFVTKGDANEDPDPRRVSASAVRGRVVFGVPRVGALVRAAHTPIGFFGLLVLPALLVIAQEARSIRRNLRTSATSPRHRQHARASVDGAR